MSKMKTGLAGMLSMAIAMDSTTGLSIFPEVDDLKETKITPGKSFKEQEGVVKMIEEYQSILSGTSKKGTIKQARIKSKIKEWLESGVLSEEDLLIK